MSASVYITRTAACLPFEPVGNDDMEAVLGMVGNRPSRARPLVLRSNGITSRHYAIDRATGQTAMSNAQLTAQAVRERRLEYSAESLIQQLKLAVCSR